MTHWLLRLFVKNSDRTQDPGVRAAYANLACVAGILCNVLLFVGKFIVGTLFGSVAIAADAMNNLSDASSNIVSLVASAWGRARLTKSIRTAMPGMNTWPVW